jgi:N-acetylglucosaminyldiphosphoundecaprenol N-acetyl-beta-D-mannosaminyltransferase
MSSPSLARANILGVNVSAIDTDQALKHIDLWIHERQRQYICVTGVHGVMESQKDPNLKTIHNRAGLVTPDGMPLVWLSRLKGHPAVERVYGPDLMLALCEQSLIKGYRHFFFGATQEVGEKLVQRLTERFSGIQIAGYWSPPFRALTQEEDEALVDRINTSRPDIVWVGLSTPKQEYWMSSHRSRLTAPVLIGVGAAFDFHAGVKRQAPRWVQRSGLEWCFRLLSEPRRLWRRYLINNPWFLWLVLLQSIGITARGSSTQGWR